MFLGLALAACAEEAPVPRWTELARGFRSQSLEDLATRLEAGVQPARAARVVRLGSAGEAWLEVCDDGPGVGRDIANSVFEPFFTSQPSGSGLGLFICRELCESNRADLRLSNPGEPGACFRLTLQMAPAGVPAGWQEPETEVRLSRSADGDAPAPAARR